MRKLILFWLTLALVAPAVPALPAVAATPRTSVAVDTVDAPRRGEPLDVSGTVRFGPDRTVVMRDPAGDVPAQTGLDLHSATISSDPEHPAALTFTLHLADLPAARARSELVYRWDLTVDGKAFGAGNSYFTGRHGGIEWRELDAGGILLRGQPADRPSIRPYTCNWSNACFYRGLVAGHFDAAAASVEATLTLDDLGAEPGSTIAWGSPPGGVGSIRSAGMTLSDHAFHDVEYPVPQRVVELALVPGGTATPHRFPVRVPVSGDGATGRFDAVVPAAGLPPGDYDLVARACWGVNCDVTRHRVVIEG